jgi:hypothetical protein
VGPIEEIELIEPEVPTMSIHVLIDVATPQTLQVEGHIKKQRFMVLVDFSKTYNFINCTTQLFSIPCQKNSGRNCQYKYNFLQ